MAGYNERGAGRKAKLSDAQFCEIKKRLDAGEKMEALAKEYRVTRQTISNYLHKVAAEDPVFITDPAAWRKRNREFEEVETEEYTLRMELLEEQGMLASILVNLSKQQICYKPNVPYPVMLPFGLVQKLTWEDFICFLADRYFSANHVDFNRLLEQLDLKDQDLEQLNLKQLDLLRMVQKNGGQCFCDNLRIRMVYYVKNKPDYVVLGNRALLAASFAHPRMDCGYVWENTLFVLDGRGYEAIATLVACALLEKTDLFEKKPHFETDIEAGIRQILGEVSLYATEPLRLVSNRVDMDYKERGFQEISIPALHFRITGLYLSTVLEWMNGPKERLAYLISFLEKTTNLPWEKQLCTILLLDEFLCVRGRSLNDFSVLYHPQSQTFEMPAFYRYEKAFFSDCSQDYSMDLTAESCYEKEYIHVLCKGFGKRDYGAMEAMAAIRERMLSGLRFGMTSEEFLKEFGRIRTELEDACERSVQGQDPLTVISTMRLWRKRLERIEAVVKLSVRRNAERYFL